MVRPIMRDLRGRNKKKCNKISLGKSSIAGEARKIA